jgi:hypothetical protein
MALSRKTSCDIICEGPKPHKKSQEVSKMDKNTLSHTTWEYKYHKKG